MATATLEFDAPEGLTLTAKLYAVGADTELASVAATERTNDKGSYAASIVDFATGTYKLRIIDGSSNTVARGILHHVNAAAVENTSDYFDPVSDPVASVTLVDTCTTNTDMRGTDGANTTAPDNAGVAANSAAIATAQADLDIITGSDGVILATSEDIYHALIEYIFDDPVDEYTVTWFKNGARVTSGITLPKIQVVKRADGTDLVAAIAMSQIGTTGSYKYDESTNVILVDETYLAIVTATIDAGSRNFACLVSRS
jgi:hypothetical protein